MIWHAYIHEIAAGIVVTTLSTVFGLIGRLVWRGASRTLISAVDRAFDRQLKPIVDQLNDLKGRVHRLEHPPHAAAVHRKG